MKPGQFTTLAWNHGNDEHDTCRGDIRRIFFFFSQILTILFLRPYRVPYFSLHPFMFSKENQERRDESSSGWAFGHRRGGRNLSFREIGPCVAAPDRKKGGEKWARLEGRSVWTSCAIRSKKRPLFEYLAVLYPVLLFLFLIFFFCNRVAGIENPHVV